MNTTSSNRSLHWVLKIGNLKKSLYFFEKVLGLRVLRHEEFDSGCEATCNGPYAGAWSKTMIGYGPEATHFALELTYNYGIDSYKFGNDLQYIALALASNTNTNTNTNTYTSENTDPVETARVAGFAVEESQNSAPVVHGPDNYKYKIIPAAPGRSEAFAVVAIRVSNLQKARDYWVHVLGMEEFPLLPGLETSDPSILVGFGPEQTLLQLIEVQDGLAVDHASSSGRIAFACKSVQPIFSRVQTTSDVVQTPPLTLSTPGKADVVVTILQDRDGYEICFVEDEAFYQLATPTYDVIDWQVRRLKGGDGAPPPKSDKLVHGAAMQHAASLEELRALVDGTQLPVVLDFGAGWCKRCKKILPFVEKQAEAFTDKAVFISVDIAEAEDIALEYEVTAVPRFFFLNGGVKIDEYLGSTESDLRSKFHQHLLGSDTHDVRRALHWVLKIGNLNRSMQFYEGVLGLKVLRHEEFSSGCEATCNGPYNGAWSKTMVGYGPEDANFALELTYNYGIETYEQGNDLQYLALVGQRGVETLKEAASKLGYPVQHHPDESVTVTGPDGYKYRILPNFTNRTELWVAVGLRVSSLPRARDYWCNVLGLQEFPTPQGLETDFPSLCVGFNIDAPVLQLMQIDDGEPVDHGKSSGRIAFACKSVGPIFEHVQRSGDVVQTPPLTLPTPGKADVVVTILQDRDGYEICFVEDEAFYELATPTFDVIDFVERAQRGGDGHPPPVTAPLEHLPSVGTINNIAEYNAAIASDHDQLIVIEFGAGWCKNCKKVAPFFNRFADDVRGKARFYSVDIEVAEEIALHNDVTNVPHFIFFKEGEKIDAYVGSSEDVITNKVTSLLPRTNEQRSLHWVLKIGNLEQSLRFFEGVLGLRVMRHEEFDSGCEATCNGPYAGAWSKTMIAYGPEKANFALELTYNYGINEYDAGNDLQYVGIVSPWAMHRAYAFGFAVDQDKKLITGPDGYKYKVLGPTKGRAEAFVAIGLRVSNLQRAKDYWCGVLGMKEHPIPEGLETTFASICVGFSADQTLLQLMEVDDGAPVNHAKASGRIAFACKSVQPIFEKVQRTGDVVQTPPLTLPTPGKVDVVVTILQDRDGYEICFVEDDAFYDLATPTYDVVDFPERASRGGDGHPPPSYK